MYEKLLSEAEKFLEEQKTKELPILEMWEGLAQRAGKEKFEMPENIGDFECLLEADKRFIFINNKLAEEVDTVDVGEEEGEYEVSEDYFEVEEMEKLGFNQHQVIGLKKYEKKKNSDDDDDDLTVKPRPAAKAKTAAKKVVKKKKTALKKSKSTRLKAKQTRPKAKQPKKKKR